MDTNKQPTQVFENLTVLHIFRTFRTAVHHSKLIIAFLALVFICFAGWIMDFSNTVVVTPEVKGQTTELQLYIANTEQVQTFIKEFKERGDKAGVFGTLWRFTSEKFNNAVNKLSVLELAGMREDIFSCFKAIAWALKYHLVYCIIFFAIELAVISVAGGAICRITALQFGRGEKPGLTEALEFSKKRFKDFFIAPVAPLAIIIFTGLFISLLGVVGNIPMVGELIIGISMPLALIAGLIITLVAIGAAVGFNLMFPAIAYDGADFFDAISRSFNYIYSRPWRMGFYTVVAAVYGAICYLFVRFFVFLLLLATHWFLQFGIWVESSEGFNKLEVIWPKPHFMNLVGFSSVAPTNWAQSIAAFLVHIFVLFIVGLLVSFVISFYFSANTIIYSLMRNSVDHTAFEDVYTHSDENNLLT